MSQSLYIFMLYIVLLTYDIKLKQGSRKQEIKSK